eukprot:TRINITY_DN31059_c0_g1_i2.p2 TRINITY_DN31059_c0_g1~~TRINITY_DN31059_c0_g1_i2.p2  ORF type:complete len:111 (-),score=21.94 TRINITY_DN31059_c0_g1_i2:4-336(-)
MMRRPPRSTHCISSAASDVYKRQVEDILEELVGDIMDEFDKEEPEVQELAPGVFVVDAQMWVEEINERMHFGLPTDEAYETIGGLIIDRLGHLPQHPGEKVEIEHPCTLR